MTEYDDLINRLAVHGTTATILNALHACRSGHPLNNSFQWRDAWFHVAQNPRMFIGVSPPDVIALRDRAALEA